MSILRSINIYAGGVTGTWTAPLNLLDNSVLVECYGGGGAGARTGTTAYRGGGGGGGGAYSKAIMTVTPGVTYDIWVGLGGYFISTSEVTNGEDTTFTDDDESVCRGRGASSPSIGSYTASSGASFVEGDGDSGFSGGAGGNAQDINFCSGGGGGGAGGPSGAGTAGATGIPYSTYATGGIGGGGFAGNGGFGLYFSAKDPDVKGNWGLSFGGGGAGGYRITYSNNGGNGGNGLLRLTWKEGEGTTQAQGVEVNSLIMANLSGHPEKEGFYIVNKVLYYQFPVGTIYTVDVTEEA